MTGLRADLHVHSYYSDGLNSPSEIIAEAKNNGVQLVALTDHDTMLGVAEAQRAAQSCGVKLVHGLEVSAYDKGVKLHTLGYNVDGGCKVYKSFARELYEGSIIRAEDCVSKLLKCGVNVTMDDVLSIRKSDNSPVHSMHIAEAGAKKGYADNRYSFYLEYLAPGKCASSQLCRPSPERAIEIINASGGFASIAHPGRIDLGKQELIDLIKRLSACGLRGIEAVYSTHTNDETAYYKEMADTFRLLVTGGSDTHFKGGKKRIGTPVFNIGEALAEELGIDKS